MKLNNQIRVFSCKILDATSMHLPGTEVYRTLGLEQHSSPTQNTNIQIYDLFLYIIYSV